MSTAQLRQRLHDIIDNVEDKKLKAIYTLLEGDTYEYSLSPAQKKELDNRLDDYKNGRGNNYTWEETVALMDQALAAKLK